MGGTRGDRPHEAGLSTARRGGSPGRAPLTPGRGPAPQGGPRPNSIPPLPQSRSRSRSVPLLFFQEGEGVKKCCTVREPVSERRAANQRALLRKLPFMARAAAAPPYKTRRRAAQPLLRPSAARTGHSTSPLVRLRRPTPPPGKPAGWPGARSAPALTARPFHRPALLTARPARPGPWLRPRGQRPGAGSGLKPWCLGAGLRSGRLPGAADGPRGLGLEPGAERAVGCAGRDGTGRTDGRRVGGRGGASPAGWGLGTGHWLRVLVCACARAPQGWAPRPGRGGAAAGRGGVAARAGACAHWPRRGPRGCGLCAPGRPARFERGGAGPRAWLPAAPRAAALQRLPFMVITQPA